MLQYSDTPFDLALANDHDELASFLIESGATVNWLNGVRSFSSTGSESAAGTQSHGTSILLDHMASHCLHRHEALFLPMFAFRHAG